MNGQGQLLQTRKICSLNCNAKTDERIVDRRTAVALAWFLIWARDADVAQIWHAAQCTNECRNIGSCMKDWRVLLCEIITEFLGPILRSFDL